MAKTMGRPVDPDAKRNPVMIRMDDGEKADLDWLTEQRNTELRGEGVKVKAPDVLRWLLRREVEARRGVAGPALAHPVEAAPKATSKPKRGR
jgi:hypothetical protein